MCGKRKTARIDDERSALRRGSPLQHACSAKHTSQTTSGSDGLPFSP